MSVCGPTEEESVSEEPTGAGQAVRELYEQKAVSTVVRVLTVLAYLLSVSLAAILLSVYYVCVWQSPKLPLLNDTDDAQLSALRADPHYNHTHHHHSYNQTRGGNTTVSEVTSPPPELSSLPEASRPPDPPPPTYSDPPDNFTLSFEDSNDTWTMANSTDER